MGKEGLFIDFPPSLCVSLFTPEFSSDPISLEECLRLVCGAQSRDHLQCPFISVDVGEGTGDWQMLPESLGSKMPRDVLWATKDTLSDTNQNHELYTMWAVHPRVGALQCKGRCYSFNFWNIILSAASSQSSWTEIVSEAGPPKLLHWLPRPKVSFTWKKLPIPSHRCWVNFLALAKLWIPLPHNPGKGGSEILLDGPNDATATAQRKAIIKVVNST